MYSAPLMPAAMVAYGPLAIVLRLTMYPVAPTVVDHERSTWPSLPIAVRLAGAAGGAIQEWMALLTSSRPPVMVNEASALTGWTVPSRASFKAAVLSVHRDSTSTAAPDTWGAAIDVPLPNA